MVCSGVRKRSSIAAKGRSFTGERGDSSAVTDRFEAVLPQSSRRQARPFWLNAVRQMHFARVTAQVGPKTSLVLRSGRNSELVASRMICDKFRLNLRQAFFVNIRPLDDGPVVAATAETEVCEVSPEFCL